jgi:hypothetical protein
VGEDKPKAESADTGSASKKEEAASPAPQVAKTDLPQAQAASPAPAQAAEAPKAEAKKKREKPANCAVCNKSIRKKRWYYRNGKYYCTKRCWKTTLKKKDQPAEPAT